MWPQIQCPGIVSYIYAVKIAQLQIPVKYIILLQNIATQLPSIRGKTNISMNLSELGHHADVQYTRKGPAPLSGVFKLGRRIFIGRYPGTWGSEPVTPHHKEIHQDWWDYSNKTSYSRYNSGVWMGGRPQWSRAGQRGLSGVRGRGQGRGCGDTNDLPSQLILQMKQLTRKISALSGSEVKDSPTPEPEKSNPGNNAGSEFGGRLSKKLRKEWLIWCLCQFMRIMCYIFFMVVLRGAKQYSWLKQKGINRIYKSWILEFKNYAQYICAAHPMATQEIDFVVGNIELDIHADTKVTGNNCTVLAYTDQKWNVAPYFDEYASVLGVSIVHAATEYTTADRRNFILVLNEDLNFPNLPHSLVNQNQLRHFGADIQDNSYLSDPMTLLSPEELLYCVPGVNW